MTQAQKLAVIRKAAIGLVLFCVATWAMMGRSSHDPIGQISPPDRGSSAPTYTVVSPTAEAKLQPLDPTASKASIKPVAPRDRAIPQPTQTPGS